MAEPGMTNIYWIKLMAAADVYPLSPNDRRPCSVELPNPTFWQRNLSLLKWE